MKLARGIGRCVLLFSLTAFSAPALIPTNGAYHVFPGGHIQEALDAAAADAQIKIVKVHSGLYRPEASGQAFIWLNARHDGIRLEADGDVTLTAANPTIADSKSASYPAVVNHVVYFGTGVSSNTVLRGFKITGANNFVTKTHTRRIEPNTRLEFGLFFYTDGGAVKIYGRSYPTLDQLEITNNYSSPCAGGVSIEHPKAGANGDNRVCIRNCIFRNNRAQVTGAALDLLEGSDALVQNCLFVGNASNLGADFISVNAQELQFTNNGVLTVFRNSRVILENCTFTGNRNGVDDMGRGSTYRRSIFWENTFAAGLPAPRFELDLADGTGVSDCRVHGNQSDLKNTVAKEKNNFSNTPPNFRPDFEPAAPGFEGIGYRPIR